LCSESFLETPYLWLTEVWLTRKRPRSFAFKISQRCRAGKVLFDSAYTHEDTVIDGRKKKGNRQAQIDAVLVTRFDSVIRSKKRFYDKHNTALFPPLKRQISAW
jgi:hypothetical protein